MIDAHLRLSRSWTPRSRGVSKIGVNVIVDLRISGTLQTGAVGNRTYRAGESVYLFLEFTITAIRLDMRSEYCVDLRFVIWVTGFEPC